MEQITLFAGQDWKTIVNNIYSTITSNEELPANSLLIEENYSRDGKTITSYSLALKKPDYPSGINPNGAVKTPLMNVKEQHNKKDNADAILVSLSDKLLTLVESQFPGIVLVNKKAETTKAMLVLDDSRLEEYLSFFISKSLELYFSEGGNAFGCCHLFEKCSDTQKCLHDNKLYARGCIYRKRLESGQIYYGKNRNVSY